METKTSPKRTTALDYAEQQLGAAMSRTEWTLVVFEVLLAVGAIGGAAGLLFGNILGDATELLPFGSAVLAGIALAVINGLWPLAVAIGARRRQRWADWGHLSVGVALMGWIVVQIYYLGPPIHWLQVGYFALGLGVAGLASRLLLTRRRSVE